MPADIIAGVEIAAADQRKEEQPAGEPSSYPRQSPSSRSRVTG